jgi:hypothetical protein
MRLEVLVFLVRNVTKWRRVKEWHEEEIVRENEPKNGWMKVKTRQSDMKELSWSGKNEERDESQER